MSESHLQPIDTLNLPETQGYAPHPPSTASSNRRSPGKRWQTTTHSALEEVASKIDPTTRGNVVDDLRQRKIANNKTSILFGNESVNYHSLNMEQQQTITRGFDIKEREEQLQRNKDMKANLTKANFCLGDEKVDYETTFQRGLKPINGKGTHMPIIKPKMNSSINFGTERPDYTSVAHQAMTYRGNGNDFNKMKEEVVALKTHLRKHNFSLGEEHVDYQSDYRRGFPPIASENYNHGDRKAALKKVIEDTRKCHFSLGQDQVDYVSNTHRAQNIAPPSNASDVFKQMEHARQMKQQLQKTSIVVGFDPEYY